MALYSLKNVHDLNRKCWLSVSAINLPSECTSSQPVKIEWTIKWLNATELNASHSWAEVSTLRVYIISIYKQNQPIYSKFWIFIRIYLNLCEHLREIQCENLGRTDERLDQPSYKFRMGSDCLYHSSAKNETKIK